MKRKHLIYLFTLLFVAAFSASAMAFTMDFHGIMWQTIGATTNQGNLNSPQKSSGLRDTFRYDGGTEGISNFDNVFDDQGETFGLTKARITFEGKTDDGLAKFVYGLEVGTGNWGDKSTGFGLSGDGINQETRFAYADVGVPFICDQKNHRLVAGLQSTKINHWVWTETAAGLTYNGKYADWNWKLGWFRGDNGGINNQNNDSADDDYFVAKVEGKVSKEVKLGLFGVYKNDGSEKTDVNDVYKDQMYWVGLTGDIKSGLFFANFDAIYQGGDIEFQNDPTLDDVDRSAWLGNLTLGVKPIDALKVYANVLYVSGDDDANDGDADNFSSIDVDVKVGQIFFKDSLLGDCDRFTSDAPYFQDRGLITYALGAAYQIDKKNDVRVEARYLQTEEDFVNSLGADDSLGTELDLWYAYKYNKNVKFRVETAYLIADDAADLMNSKNDADDIFQFVTGVELKF